jgi:hypothetical protein
MWTMGSDGADKTLLVVAGEPSRLLHGGFRWFLQRRPVPGTYPNGAGRNEIFAVRGDGNEAFTRQLTDSPVVDAYHGGQPLTLTGTATWLPGDVGISDIAREWDADAVGGCPPPPYPQPNPCVVDGGIYSWNVTFDADGNVASPPQDAGAPIAAFELSPDGNGETWPNANSHDWSPDAEEIVYGVRVGALSSSGISAVVVATGQVRVLTDDGVGGRWSPDASRIMFGRYNSVWTIVPDGTGLQRILAGQGSYNVAAGSWSPTGSHVTYYRYNPGCALCQPSVSPLGDVYRATASGGSRTNLTGDVAADARPRGWR